MQQQAGPGLEIGRLNDQDASGSTVQCYEEAWWRAMSTWSVDLGSAIVSAEVKVDDVGEILAVAPASSGEVSSGRGHAEWGTSTVEKVSL